MSLTDAQRPANRRERYRTMADAATRPFAVGAVAVPLVLPVLGYLSGDVRIMFTVHLFLGAFWFGTAVLGAVVLGPVMGSLSEEANAEFAEGFVPKMNLLMEPVSLGVVGSGVGLAGLMGLWDSPTPSLWAAVALAAALLVLGFGPLHKFTAGMFDEIAADDTDHERLADLNKKYGMLSLVELVLMVAIVGTMSGLRWGF
ncbi:MULTISPECIES: hypothetical protein [unclassified Halobacterium]|uniref:hypothetical protein n=1 Tax=unclassified Halobacterium TaxID=2668073 RepID=UPI001E59DAB7|nr:MULTISPECIES: hypothetical protein [unclassified Halobacterium]MCD2199323.1 hypothetical protein [Halobacterium sp. KA-4]MCD2202379.1 hypothetical protein [Halobacterium sp. KA-6]